MEHLYDPSGDAPIVHHSAESGTSTVL